MSEHMRTVIHSVPPKVIQWCDTELVMLVHQTAGVRTVNGRRLVPLAEALTFLENIAASECVIIKCDCIAPFELKGESA